jgi:hypothetical protein
MLEQQIRLTPDPLERLRIYMSVANVAQRAGDTALVRRIAQGIIARADSLPAPIRQRLDSGVSVVVGAQAYLAKEALLDSLRRGTPQYVALMRSFLTRLWGTQQAPSLLAPIGDRAAPIAGEFWFRRERPNAPRPTPGRVSLIVFFRGGCQAAISSLERKWANDDSCWSEAATLRRLALRFPALDITLVEHTRGYFASAALDTPAAEAEWFRRWADAHRLPGALSVTVTPFRRLPDPDHRRVDELAGNFKNYPRAIGVGVPLAFLVDRNGVIVHQNVFGSPGALEDQPGLFGLRWVDLIEILLSRDGTASAP